MKRFFWLLLGVCGCVGEDIVMDEVDPEVRITNAITNMQINSTWQFEYMYLNSAGMDATPDEVIWSTSDAFIATIDENGLARAQNYGAVSITLSATEGESETDTTITFQVTDDLTVVNQGVRTGSIQTTSSYVLTGDFEVSIDDGSLTIRFSSDYVADQNLPGLYVYLTNNPNSPAGGYEIGPVTVFDGAHSYTIPGIDLFDYDYLFYYCKPFKVKVGHGDIE